jgi:hypothetical protein
MTNDGFVLGHWFGDQRLFNDGIGGHSQSLHIGYSFGKNYLRANFRQMGYDIEWAGPGAQRPYKQLQEVGLQYSTEIRGYPFTLEALTGKDILGRSFARLSGSFSLATNHTAASNTPGTADESTNTTLLLDFGINRGQVNKILEAYVPRVSTPLKMSVHYGIGARRQISENGDLAVRVEFDKLDGHDLFSIRAVDYRYRLGSKVAVGGFLGAGRYNPDLPSYGWYTGLGIQYLSVVKNWDINFDWYQHYKLGRDKVLATDPPATAASPRVFFDTKGLRLYLTRRY